MLTTIVLALVVPAMAGAACLALRGRLCRATADTRGIALQTVVVIVVLLAIAGGVATVLLTRGGEAVEDLDEASIAPEAASYNNETLCTRAGHSWSGGTNCLPTA